MMYFPIHEELFRTPERLAGAVPEGSEVYGAKKGI